MFYSEFLCLDKIYKDIEFFILIIPNLNFFIYFLYAELSHFYHYMSWTVPSWCNLQLQQCSINIIQTLHSVCVHIEDVYLLIMG